MIMQTFTLGLVVVIVIILVFQSYKREHFADDENFKFAKKISDFDDYYSETTPPITVIHPDSFLLDDGNGGKSGLHTNLCSKACCSSQYPLPFNLKFEQSVCENKNNFVPNNIMCNNAWQDSGCLCLTKEQANNLYSRGGNAT